MSAAMIGAVIAVSPLVLLLVALIAKATSTADGRWGALLVFGATTLTMTPLIVGMAIADNPKWVVAAWTMAGLDALVAAIAVTMVLVGRRKATQ